MPDITAVKLDSGEQVVVVAGSPEARAFTELVNQVNKLKKQNYSLAKEVLVLKEDLKASGLRVQEETHRADKFDKLCAGLSREFTAVVYSVGGRVVVDESALTKAYAYKIPLDTVIGKHQTVYTTVEKK